ncbi:hypothetical protein [Endozoicomonas atrinae]|uniref:hypothetical protein n=1 Tax=Endozoicomonas atrinae TaxID=1333660 RepID=UPI00082693D2|nr:hypothetical protein [Endozoicomonas atrinae]
MFNAEHSPEEKAQILTDMIRERSDKPLDKNALQSIIHGLLQDLQKDLGSTDQLVTLSSLAKVANVTKSVSPIIGKMLQKLEVPLVGSLSTLNDADQRYYVAKSLEWFEPDEFLPFAAYEAVREDTGERVRAELVSVIFSYSNSLKEAFGTLYQGCQTFIEEAQMDGSSKLLSESSLSTRFRRLFACVDDTLKQSSLPAGDTAGVTLARFIGKAFSHLPVSQTTERWPAADAAITLLQTYLRSHFSVVVEATSYAALTQIKGWFRAEDWLSYCGESNAARLLSNDIEEALILLARFGRADKDMMDCFIQIQGNRDKARLSLNCVIEQHPDIPSDLHEWLANTGVVKVQNTKIDDLQHRSIEQQTDNLSADLLLQAGLLSPRLKVFSDDAFPTLQMFNPGAAGQVKYLLNANKEILMTLRQLVTTRNLRAKGQINDVLEYQAAEHEVAGGHKPGTRKVRVLRPAVERKDGQKTAIVRKALVEAVVSGENL